METEVMAKAKRRSFTAEYKKRILEQADRALASGDPGALGALLRREGLYSSHLTVWRKARDSGELAGLEPKKRGRPKKEVDPRDEEIAELKRQLAKERARLEKAELIIDVQKKVSTLLGIKLPETEES
jgi:transposase-like protein